MLFESKRHPNRIFPFLFEIGNIWITECPQWRFGQFMENVMGYIKNNGDDPFFLEETAFREYIEKYLMVNDEI